MSAATTFSINIMHAFWILFRHIFTQTVAMPPKHKMPKKATEHAQSANPDDGPLFMLVETWANESVDGLSLPEHKFCMDYVANGDNGTAVVLKFSPGVKLTYSAAFQCSLAKVSAPWPASSTHGPRG